jgi:hypothetical protein
MGGTADDASVCSTSASLSGSFVLAVASSAAAERRTLGAEVIYTSAGKST